MLSALDDSSFSVQTLIQLIKREDQILISEKSQRTRNVSWDSGVNRLVRPNNLVIFFLYTDKLSNRGMVGSLSHRLSRFPPFNNSLQSSWLLTFRGSYPFKIIIITIIKAACELYSSKGTTRSQGLYSARTLKSPPQWVCSQDTGSGIAREKTGPYFMQKAWHH